MDGKTRSMVALLTLGAAACGSGRDGAGTTTGGTAGSGGGSNTGGSGATSTAATWSASSTSAVAGTGGTGGAAPFACDPPAAPGSLYELSAEAYAEVDPISMCRYRGDVLLIVNTAAA